MTSSSTSRIYFGGDVVGGKYFVHGIAYPPEQEERYSSQRQLDEHVDARAILGNEVGSDSYRVLVGHISIADHFRVEIPDDQAHDRYTHLVKTLEGQLGGSALNIIVY